MSEQRVLRSKDCARCGKSFHEDKGDSRANFEARRYCSNRCRSEAQRKILPPRHCPVCGALLVKRDTETNYDFRTRKTCGWNCAMRSVGRLAHIPDWAKGAGNGRTPPDRPVSLRERDQWPEGMRFEDDPRAVAEAGVALNMLPPPTETERGAAGPVDAVTLPTNAPSDLVRNPLPLASIPTWIEKGRGGRLMT